MAAITAPPETESVRPATTPGPTGPDSNGPTGPRGHGTGPTEPPGPGAGWGDSPGPGPVSTGPTGPDAEATGSQGSGVGPATAAAPGLGRANGRTAFAQRETPQARERIASDIAKVVRAVTAADAGVRSIILTGGFARGEGTVVRGVPQNDYDFVAVRGHSNLRPSYRELREDLTAELGIHIDLAPVSKWRLPFVEPSIFWYETAASGRVVWGDDFLGRIRIQDPSKIHPNEGLRLLVNRAAGLLLYSKGTDDEKRLQAAKAILGATDTHVLAAGQFVSGQALRRARFDRLARWGLVSGTVKSWSDWAHAYKADPTNAPYVTAQAAWDAGRKAVLDTLPTALRHAGFETIEEYGEVGGLVDQMLYRRRSHGVPGGKRWLRRPSGQVRVATIRLLESAEGGRIPTDAAEHYLAGLGHVQPDPLKLLDALRGATLQ